MIISCTFIHPLHFQAIFTKFEPFQPFWANFNMLGIKKHALRLRNSMVIFSQNFAHVFMQFRSISCKFQANFTQFGLFQQFLGQFQHVGYQKACTRAEKFIGDTFTIFNACIHAFSHKFHAIFTQFRLFQPFLGQFQHVGYQKACT